AVYSIKRGIVSIITLLATGTSQWAVLPKTLLAQTVFSITKRIVAKVAGCTAIDPRLSSPHDIMMVTSRIKVYTQILINANDVLNVIADIWQSVAIGITNLGLAQWQFQFCWL